VAVDPMLWDLGSASRPKPSVLTSRISPFSAKSSIIDRSAMAVKIFWSVRSPHSFQSYGLRGL
jgi:hypothetical protein